MAHINTYEIITKKVLNENTGELENKDFRETKEVKKIRRGYRMVYKSYDDAISEIIRSQIDYKIVTYIRDMFTYQRTENIISSTKISKYFNVSKSKVDTLIKRMKEQFMIINVSKGVYRLNPYMYLPYQSDAEFLQSEWDDISPIKVPHK